MACRLLSARSMLALRPTTALSSGSSGLPQAIDAFVGSALELMIHSIETLRDHVGKMASRGAWLRSPPTP
jgi:hypothetical protein